MPFSKIPMQYVYALFNLMVVQNDGFGCHNACSNISRKGESTVILFTIEGRVPYLCCKKSGKKKGKSHQPLEKKQTCKPVFDLSMYRKMVVCIVWPFWLQGLIAFSFFLPSLRTGMVKGKMAPSPSLEIFLNACDIINTSFCATNYCQNTRREHCYSRRWGLTPSLVPHDCKGDT